MSGDKLYAGWSGKYQGHQRITSTRQSPAEYPTQLLSPVPPAKMVPIAWVSSREEMSTSGGVYDPDLVLPELGMDLPTTSLSNGKGESPPGFIPGHFPQPCRFSNSVGTVGHYLVIVWDTNFRRWYPTLLLNLCGLSLITNVFII